MPHGAMHNPPELVAIYTSAGSSTNETRGGQRRKLSHGTNIVSYCVFQHYARKIIEKHGKASGMMLAQTSSVPTIATVFTDSSIKEKLSSWVGWRVGELTCKAVILVQEL